VEWCSQITSTQARLLEEGVFNGSDVVDSEFWVRLESLENIATVVHPPLAAIKHSLSIDTT
jgi:hypothetical protein